MPWPTSRFTPSWGSSGCHCHVLCCGGMFRVIQYVIVMAICYCIVVGIGFVLVFSLVFLFCVMYPSILLGGLRIQKRQGCMSTKNTKKHGHPQKMVCGKKKTGWCRRRSAWRAQLKKRLFDQQKEDMLDQQKEDMRPKDMWIWVLI